MPPNNDPDKPTLTYWLYIVSPCVVAAAFVMYAIIDSYSSMEKSQGWSFIGLLIGIPAFILLIAFDLMLKAIVKKTPKLWLLEVAALLVMFILFKAST